MPVEVGLPGEYYFDSFIGEYVNEDRVSYCCVQTYSFTIDDPNTTGIGDAPRLNDKGQMINDKWFDLQGRKLNERPTCRGLYIQGNKKIFIQ